MSEAATGKPDIIVDGCDTFAKLFLKKSTERGDAIAMREKDFGIWQSYTWNDYRDRAMEVANGSDRGWLAARRCCIDSK